MRRLLIVLLSLFASNLLAQAPHPLAESVVVVANGAVEGSVELARYYAQQRGIPEKNIIELKLPAAEQISRQAFIQDLFNPLLKTLVERELVVGLIEEEPDALGRLQVNVLANPTRYLVLVYGVPYKVTTWGLLDDRELFLTFARQTARQNLPDDFELPKAMNRNEASVDAELFLLLQRNIPYTFLIPNPLFGRADHAGAPNALLRVSRLDGPTLESARALVDNALYAEQNGLRGRAYIDSGGRRGEGYDIGNTWIEGAGAVAKRLGFDTVEDSRGPMFGPEARFDAPALYFGWYASSLEGPFTLPEFRFPPGAIAAHLYSYSAANFKTNPNNWVGAFVARGVTATVGNVNEPYLNYTHNFNVLMEVLAEGGNFGDAATVSLPVLSWQSITIGDPLYTPFQKDLRAQLEALAAPEADAWGPYAVLRQVNLSSAQNGADTALKDAALGYRTRPHAALALHLAQAQLLAGQKREAQATLAQLPDPVDWPSSDWGLWRDVADRLLELGEEERAYTLYRQLLSQRQVPREVEKSWLQAAAKAAREAGERGQGQIWLARWEAIVAEERAEAEAARAAREAEQAQKKAEREAAEKAKATAEPSTN